MILIDEVKTMQNYDRQNLMRALSKHKLNQIGTEESPVSLPTKANIYDLAYKHGLGDVLDREIPEPKDMDEMNEQIQTIEEVIKSMRAHIQTQYRRLTRRSMKGVLL
jgi:hypothetical protein